MKKMNEENSEDDEYSSQKVSEGNTEDDSHSSENDSEEEEREEPKLKYEWLFGDIQQILQNNEATSIFVNDKLLIVGTKTGRIYVFDHQGNRVTNFNLHSAPVTMLDMDSSGDYLASGATNRKVLVQALYSSEVFYDFTACSPLKCVALEPNFGKTASKKRFIVGTNQIVLFEKGLFGSLKSILLYDNSGKHEVIRNIKWEGRFMAWAMDSAVRVMDMENRSIISLVKRDHSLALGCDQYPPHLCWQDDCTLLIGWGDSIKVCRIRERRIDQEYVSLDLPRFYVEIVYMFLTDFYICGIASLDEFLVVLSYNKSCYNVAMSQNLRKSAENLHKSGELLEKVRENLEKCQRITEKLDKSLDNLENTKENWNKSVENLKILTDTFENTTDCSEKSLKDLEDSSSNLKSPTEHPDSWKRPQIRVINPLQRSYEELSKDVLAIRGYQNYQPIHYHLACLIEERRFYVMCPKYIVVAKTRESHDRVRWLIEHRKFQEALKLVEECGGRVGSEYTQANVGQIYVDYLLENEQFEHAANVAFQVLGRERILWEKCIERFKYLRKLKYLSKHIPTGPPLPLLSSAIYQDVLVDLLNNDHQVLLEIVQTWPKNIYDVQGFINEVQTILARKENMAGKDILLRVLAHLYSNIDVHNKALAIYLKLQHKDVFQLINRHSLYWCVSRHIVELMNLDTTTCLDMCIKHVKLILPDEIVKKLSRNLYFLYQYLDKLYENDRDSSMPYHNELLQLYAKYDRSKIMPLLLASSSIKLEPALDLAWKYDLVKEAVYLLIRMGNGERALKLVLDKQKDINWAINICKEHCDPDLWKILIDRSLADPEYIRVLLENVGSHVDPLLILRDIPSNMKIPGLRDALAKIMHDYQLKVALQTGFQKIVVTDSIKLLEKQVNSQRTGIHVRTGSECSICDKILIGKGDLNTLPFGESDLKSIVNDDIVVFYCRHAYHAKCLSNQLICVICCKSKRIGVT